MMRGAVAGAEPGTFMPDWNAEPSTLYVVATPIGNLADLSARASEVLRTVTWVAAEDTRQTRKLMAHLGAGARLRSLHRGNEARTVPALVRSLRTTGASGALVSDAGTPLVSDPGRWLVEAALRAGIAVVPLPGPCAVVAALSVAGLDAARFVFEGFLPARAVARRRRVAELACETRTWAVYEAPHRIRALAGDIKEVLEPDRQVAWVRELTKRHEEAWRGAVGELDPERIPERGEFVVVVEGAGEEAGVPDQDLDAFLEPLLEAGLGVRTAAALARDCLGAAHKAAYARALALKR